MMLKETFEDWAKAHGYKVTDKVRMPGDVVLKRKNKAWLVVVGIDPDTPPRGRCAQTYPFGINALDAVTLVEKMGIVKP